MDDKPTTSTMDKFDRALHNLDGRPDVLTTAATTVVTVPYLTGPVTTFIVQTKRVMKEGDTIFLQYLDEEGSRRIVIPAKVANVMARQRESLTAKSRKRAAQQGQQTKKEKAGK
jgi:hypothetical protein